MLSFNKTIKQFSKILFLLIISLLLIKAKTIQIKVLILFFSTIINFIIKIFDFESMTICSITLGVIFNIFSINQALTGFCYPVIWQIMMFLALSKVLIKTGLSKRIALYIIYYFGKNTLTLNYGLAILTTFFALTLPTSTARIGGIIIPILNSILNIIDSEDQNLKQNLAFIVLYSNAIASAMFFCANSSNFYIQEILAKNNIFFTGLEWSRNAIIPGIIIMIALPFIVHFFTIKNTQHLDILQIKIKKELELIHNFSIQEFSIMMIFLFIFTFWSFNFINLTPLTIIFIGIIFCILTNLINVKEDILQNQEMWGVFLWVSHILTLTSLIREYNAFENITAMLIQITNFLPNNLQNFFIIIVYGYTQYLFASSTVHVMAFYEIALKILLQNKFSIMLTTFFLSYSSSLFCGLTTYSSTEAILLNKEYNFGSKIFLIKGFIISTIIFISFFSIGTIYWKLIGV